VKKVDTPESIAERNKILAIVAQSKKQIERLEALEKISKSVKEQAPSLGSPRFKEQLKRRRTEPVDRLYFDSILISSRKDIDQ